MEWLLHLPVLWMGLVIFAANYLIAAVVYWSSTKLTGDRGRLVDPGILSPLGVVFGLLITDNAVADEASALRDVVLLARSLPEDDNSRLRALVERHIDVSETEEWPAMANGRAVIAMPTALREALREALRFATVDDNQRTAKSEIIKSLQKALDARRQRIVISQTNVSRVRWFGLLVTGLCVLIGIAFAHLDNLRNCRIALVLFATGMSASILIIACHSRPFNSTVGPELLHEIKAQYSID
jgi:hypothetical protein